MAQQFFIRRGNQEQGPLTPDQLKQLASSGQLATTDLVRTAEKPEWRQAGAVKGLFQPASSSSPIPPPPPPRSPQSSPAPSTAPATATSNAAHVASTVQSGLTDVLTTAKQAKDLAAAHARKTQINQMTLPKAYLALGKEVFEAGRLQEQFADLFQRITAINDEIAKVAATDKERPQASDLKGKLQSSAAHLLAQGQGAKLGLQRDSLLRELGQKAFETHGPSAGSDAVIAEITQAHAEIGRLDQEIGRLSAASGGKLLTPKRILIGLACVAPMILCCGGLSLLSVGEFRRSGPGSVATHDYSRDDYSLPAGAKKEVREEPGTSGGWTVSEGYVTAQGDFITHGKFERWYAKDKKHKWAVSMYRHDKLHGKCEAWYEDGQKKAEYYCVDDKNHGPSVQWWPNSQKRQEASYLNGEFHGHVSQWDEKGLQTHSGTMERGKPIGTWRFGFKSIASSQPYFMETDDKPWSGGTQADFICKMHFLNLRLGNEAMMLPRDHRAGPCVCRTKEDFTDLFGPPASDRAGDTQFGDRIRLWTYRCSDGPVVVRARSSLPSGAPWAIEIER